jgi:hypothetical protein
MVVLNHLIKSVALILAFLVTGGTGRSDFVVPVQTVNIDANPVPLGELAGLSVSPITTSPANWVSSTYTWAVVGQDGRERKLYEGKSGEVFFGAGLTPMRMRVICVASHLYVVKTGDAVSNIAVRTTKICADIQIGLVPPAPPDPTPPAPPGPTPPPAPPVPTPTFPDGKFKLAAWTFAAANKVAASGRPAQAAALAAALKGMSSAVRAGAIKDPTDLLQKTLTANLAALAQSGGLRDDWLPFFKLLQSHVYDDFYATKQINTIDDFATAFDEIAMGLGAVK